MHVTLHIEQVLVTAGGRITCQRCTAQSKRTKLQCGIAALKGKKNVSFMAEDPPDRKHPKAEHGVPKPKRFTATTQEQTAPNTVKKWQKSVTSRPLASKLVCLRVHVLLGANQNQAAR